MKNTIITILLFTVNFSVYAQNGWQVAQCYCPATSIIFSRTSNLGMASGNFGFVKKTTDGGLNWRFLFPTINDQYTDQLHLLNDNLIFAREGFYSNNNDTLYKSTNFGNNWVRVNSCPQFVYSQFIDDNTIFGLTDSYTTMYYSSNAGINWIQKTLPFPIQKMYFTDNLNGWIVDNSSRIAHTTNSGTDWVLQQSGVTCYFLDVYFINSSTGWACGDNGKIIKTTNSGNNWFTQNSGVYTTLRQIKFRDSNTGWAICNTGIFNRTTNGGLDWYQSNYDNIPSEYYNYYFDFVGTSSVYIYGLNSYLSSNNGANWTMVDSAFKAYLLGDIQNTFFLNQSTGWYCGCNQGFPEFDIIRKTTNGGMNWITSSSNIGLYPISLYFINEQTGFAVGAGRNNNSSIMKTTNSGTNWIYINNGLIFWDAIYNIKFVDINTGYLLGNMGCYKTTNCGTNWIVQSNILGKELSIANNGAFICYVGDNGTFVLTTNGGTNWINRSNVDLNELQTVFFVNSNTGWIGGIFDTYSNTNYFWKTTNAGINWISQDSSNLYRINSIFFINENTGWAVGYNGHNGSVKKTTNSGANWLIQKTGFLGEFFSIKMSSNEEGWISSNEGTLLHTTNAGNIFIKNISQNIPKHFLLYQNYPNPFNPTTKIKFDIPSNVKRQTSNVKLVIYNILGKEIQTLVNENLNPGSYEVTFDGSNFPSGVYFYKLSTGNYSETKKMLMIK